MAEYYTLILKIFKKTIELEDLSGETGIKLQKLLKKIDIIKFNMGVVYFVILSFLILKIIS